MLHRAKYITLSAAVHLRLSFKGTVLKQLLTLNFYSNVAATLSDFCCINIVCVVTSVCSCWKYWSASTLPPTNDLQLTLLASFLYLPGVAWDHGTTGWCVLSGCQGLHCLILLPLSPEIRIDSC